MCQAPRRIFKMRNNNMDICDNCGKEIYYTNRGWMHKDTHERYCNSDRAVPADCSQVTADICLLCPAFDWCKKIEKKGEKIKKMK